MKELKALKEKEVKRLQVKEEVSWTLKSAKVERLNVKEVESWSLKSAKVEVRLAEVLEWLVADPQVLNFFPLIPNDI